LQVVGAALKIAVVVAQVVIAHQQELLAVAQAQNQN
jgi:hypothetical protein